MRPRDRLDYSAIVDRAPLVLPDGARLVVWPIVNIENWDIDGPMPRTVLPPPMGGTLIPDLPNWAWQEYGMRVGFWRFIEVFGSRGIRATRIAHGVPVGGELEYVDGGTLAHALAGRQVIA